MFSALEKWDKESPMRNQVSLIPGIALSLIDNKFKNAYISRNWDALKKQIQETTNAKKLAYLLFNLFFSDAPSSLMDLVVKKRGNTNEMICRIPVFMLSCYDMMFHKGFVALINAGCDVNFCDDEGWSCLFVAVRYLDLDSVKMMVKAGANVNCKCASGKNALLLAINIAKFDIARFLIHSGIDCSPNPSAEQYPLFRAVTHYNVSNSFLKCLIKNNNDVNYSNEMGCTALVPAVIAGNFRVVCFLLQYHASVELRIKSDTGILSILHCTSDISILGLLIQVGAIIDDSQTILEIHLSRGKQDTVEFLIRAGINPAMSVLTRFGYQERGGIRSKWINSYQFHRIACGDMQFKFIMCAHCRSVKGEELFMCKRCTLVGYCGVECQRQHWPKHSSTCKQKYNMDKIREDLQSMDHDCTNNKCSHCANELPLIVNTCTTCVTDKTFCSVACLECHNCEKNKQ